MTAAALCCYAIALGLTFVPYVWTHDRWLVVVFMVAGAGLAVADHIRREGWR